MMLEFPKAVYASLLYIYAMSLTIYYLITSLLYSALLLPLAKLG